MYLINVCFISFTIEVATSTGSFVVQVFGCERSRNAEFECRFRYLWSAAVIIRQVKCDQVSETRCLSFFYKKRKSDRRNMTRGSQMELTQPNLYNFPYLETEVMS